MIMNREAVLQRIFAELERLFGPANFSRSSVGALAGIPTAVNEAVGQAIHEAHLKWRRIPQHVLVKCDGRLELRPDIYGRIRAMEENERALSIMIDVRRGITRLVELLKSLPQDEMRNRALADLDGGIARLTNEETKMRRWNVLGA
jgi:hypothetical protein